MGASRRADLHRWDCGGLRLSQSGGYGGVLRPGRKGSFCVSRPAKGHAFECWPSGRVGPKCDSENHCLEPFCQRTHESIRKRRVSAGGASHSDTHTCWSVTRRVSRSAIQHYCGRERRIDAGSPSLIRVTPNLRLAKCADRGLRNSVRHQNPPMSARPFTGTARPEERPCRHWARTTISYPAKLANELDVAENS